MNMTWRLCALLLAASALPPQAAGKFRCGTLDPSTLPKAAVPGVVEADLPRIPKVYAGKPTAIMVRVSFTDAPYAMSTADLDRMNDTVNAMFRSMSRNTFEFSFRHFPIILQAPGTTEQFTRDFDRFKEFIDEALADSGYVKDGIGDKGYSVYMASFAKLDIGWGGLSYGPGDGANFITGDYTAGYSVHELGHALGLPHSHSIEAGNDVFGTPGNQDQHVEYGDVYDIMGWGWPPDTHYNANYKWRLGWLDKDEAREVRNTGVYRLYNHDTPLHKGRLLGIRVPSADPRYAYWIEYRSANPSADAGAVIMFEGFLGNRTSGLHILDLTPGSREEDDFEDAVLPLGRELKDKYGTASFKLLDYRRSKWNEPGYADVQVTIPGTIPAATLRPQATARRRLPEPSLKYFGRTWSALGRSLAGGRQ